MATYTWSIPTGKAITGSTYIKDTDNNISDTIDDLVAYVNSTGAHAGQGLVFDLVDKASAQTIDGIKTFSAVPVFSAGITLGATNITATGDELNILDGVTSTTAELNILDGVTSTTAELNILDGVTSTATELNILDGVTATTAELNLVDGVTATTAELNILDGVTATTAEINQLASVTLDSGHTTTDFTLSTGTLTSIHWIQVGNEVNIAGEINYSCTAGSSNLLNITSSLFTFSAGGGTVGGHKDGAATMVLGGYADVHLGNFRIYTYVSETASHLVRFSATVTVTLDVGE